MPRFFSTSLIGAVLLFMGLSPASAALAQAAPCRFQLGFATIAALIPQQVGQCTDNEGHNSTNGDALQHSTGGLLVWRKADNWTAFTDGYHSWINGPNGLQQRLNTERFSWEADPEGLPVVGGSSAPIVAPPVVLPAQSIGTKMPESIGTTVDWKSELGNSTFHGVVTDAYRSSMLPAIYSSGSVLIDAIPAPGNSVFAVFVLTATNTGTVSDSVYDFDLAVRDVQGRSFTYGQTPSYASDSVARFFGVKGAGSSIGPSLTDKFALVYVVAPDATGLRLIPTQ